MLNKLKVLPSVFKSALSQKIFCISVQRTGTTSVGQFFKEHNFRVATWDVSKKNDWTVNWMKGDYEQIFQSKDFKFYQVFEDSPWWYQDFYKVLFYRFPNAKFILLERDVNKWFDSMVSHSNGKSLGNTHRHALLYQRLEQFYDAKFEKTNLYTSKIDNLLPIEESHRKHYTSIYKLRNLEVKSFFEHFGEERIIVLRLEDQQKWQKIGAFFKIKVDKDYEVHANKSY